MWRWLKSRRDRELEEAALWLDVAKKTLELGERTGGLTPETRERVKAEVDAVTDMLSKTRC